jgi:hypothetical protein
MPAEPKLRLSNQPVTGVFKPKRGTTLGPGEHHIGWDGALEAALKNVGRQRGRYKVGVVFSAVIDVQNPGSVIEYQATLV